MSLYSEILEQPQRLAKLVSSQRRTVEEIARAIRIAAFFMFSLQHAALRIMPAVMQIIFWARSTDCRSRLPHLHYLLIINSRLILKVLLLLGFLNRDNHRTLSASCMKENDRDARHWRSQTNRILRSLPTPTSYSTFKPDLNWLWRRQKLIPPN